MAESPISSTLKKLRKERKLTLKELAERTDVSISFLSQVERGKSGVTLESLRKIADALNVAPSAFFSSSTEQDDWAGRLELSITRIYPKASRKRIFRRSW